jgi:hypothetical protein
MKHSALLLVSVAGLAGGCRRDGNHASTERRVEANAASVPPPIHAAPSGSLPNGNSSDQRVAKALRTRRPIQSADGPDSPLGAWRAVHPRDEEPQPAVLLVPSDDESPLRGANECLSNVLECVSLGPPSKDDEALDRLFESCAHRSRICIRKDRPWDADPAGRGCCPQACIEPLSKMGRHGGQVMSYLAECYPGLDSYLRENK